MLSRTRRLTDSLGLNVPFKVNELRRRGREGLLALTGATTPPPVQLPKLRGEALARHHMALAFEALREAGDSKPSTFRRLRLLVNRLEQGAGHSLAPAPTPAPDDRGGEVAPTARKRRARLLQRAFDGATSLSSLRQSPVETHTSV